MTLKRFALYGAATLTALTLTSCSGGGGGESPSTTTTTTVAPASDQWGTPVKMSDWINSIGGTCDQFELVNDEIANCGNDSDGYYFLAQDSAHNPTAADGNRGAFMGGNSMDAEMVWGDDWSIVCYGGRVSANCAMVKNSLGMEYSSRRISASEDAVDESVEPSDSASPASTPSSVSSSPTSSGSMMDGVYADMLQDEGIDVTAGDIARASTAVCDAFDGGAGQGEALGIVEETTGATGWQATRILQASVLSRCSQYVDSTY